MGMIGTVVAAILSGIMTGTFTMRMARENLRATQIMLEKVETIRLYSWNQVTSNGFIPTDFVASTGIDVDQLFKQCELFVAMLIGKRPYAGVASDRLRPSLACTDDARQ